MHRGPEAIREYCARREFADFVINGGLEYLIPAWERTVQYLQNGYRGMVDEYLDEMAGRRIIHEVWPLASDEQHTLYGQRLAEADAQFMRYTVPVTECVWGTKNAVRNGYTPSVHWWYFREPVDKGPHW